MLPSIRKNTGRKETQSSALTQTHWTCCYMLLHVVTCCYNAPLSANIIRYLSIFVFCSEGCLRFP
jgi:hypothetical protein